MILIIDNDPDIGELMVEVLSADGHRAEAVGNGRLALDRLKQRRYDLVVSDLRMPDIDSRALYYEVVRERPAMQRRFVFVSADVIRPGMRRFLDDTQSAAFLKPFDLGAFRRTVERILRPDPAVDDQE